RDELRISVPSACHCAKPLSTTVPSGIKPVPLEMKGTCQKPIIADPAGATPFPWSPCAPAALDVLAAERMNMAVAGLEARWPSDPLHGALASAAVKHASTSIANTIETA